METTSRLELTKEAYLDVTKRLRQKIGKKIVRVLRA
jgi:hypothetical protein